MRPIHLIGTLTISNGQQNSGILVLNSFSHFAELGIFGPATLPETVTLEVTAEEKAAADYLDADFRTAESPPGTDVTVSAGSQTTVSALATFAIRLHAGAAVAGDRVFKLVGRDQSLGLK
jgi:hypothetical protein